MTAVPVLDGDTIILIASRIDRLFFFSQNFLLPLVLLHARVLLTGKDGKRPLPNQFDIVIVCPPSINTNLRRNALTPDPLLKEAGKQSQKSMSVEQCARAIVDATDRRLRKAFFPFSSFAGAYLRPLLPDLIDKKIRGRASL
jgi:hypothetical protein